ncbi:MAG: hypothetical protein FJ276_01800 [Planctomycetes bacterium]|nr:hypothetical protein [Planctomycetota bacterium]
MRKAATLALAFFAVAVVLVTTAEAGYRHGRRGVAYYGWSQPAVRVVHSPVYVHPRYAIPYSPVLRPPLPPLVHPPVVLPHGVYYGPARGVHVHSYYPSSGVLLNVPGFYLNIR